jgi:hypothetical protein
MAANSAMAAIDLTTLEAVPLHLRCLVGRGSMVDRPEVKPAIPSTLSLDGIARRAVQARAALTIIT